MMKQRRIRIALLAAALASAIALTACSSNNHAEQPAGNETAQNGAGNGANNGAGNSAGNAAGGTMPAPEEDQLIRATGIYVGQIDPHSIEIVTDNHAVAYQIAEGLEGVIESLSPDAEVTFEYVEQPIEGDDTLKQRTIMSIAPAASDSSGKLPGTKQITVELEGMKEERTASAAVADGYTIYIFEQFTFDREANRLSMNVDKDYYVDIEKRSNGASEDELRKEGEAWLKDLGDAVERKGSELHASIGDVSLFLTASSDKLTRQYMVKEIDGATYAFKINMPHREASEGFGPLAFASINSIVSGK